MQVLADTSVIVNSLRSANTRASRSFDRLLKSGPLPAITPEVFQEVLQGARDGGNFADLRDHLAGLPMLVPNDVHNTRVQAALLYASLRWQGVTVRSGIDCLIAQIAIDHDLPLLHDDRDFEAICRFDSRLKLA